MENSIVPKVRYVRCPKCREILPEPVDVPFYRCGGCETILQAKHYKKPNERREIDSEASSTINSNEVPNVAQGEEASRSNPLLLTGLKEGINAEDGTLEQASSSSQPKPAPPSAQSSLQQDEEAEQDIQVTKRKGSSSNEPSSSNHDVASNWIPETGELEGGCKYAEQRGESIASSSNESPEQLAQLVPENGVVVEERLEAEDSHSESASADAKTDGEGDEQNKSVRLDQAGVRDSTLLSNEPRLSESSNSLQVVAEKGNCTEVKDQPEQIQPIMSNESTVGGEELCSLIEEVMETGQHFVADAFSKTPASPNKSTFPRNEELPQLVTENQDIVEGGSLNDTDTSIENSLEAPPAELDSKGPEVLDTMLPEPGRTSTLSALDEYANSESQSSVTVDATTDGNKSSPSLPTYNSTVEEEEVLALDDRYHKSAEIKPIEEIKEEKVTETVEVFDAHSKAGISCKDSPESATRKSLDGIVSSCDGNNDQMVHPQLSKTIQGIERTEIPAAEDLNQILSERSTTSSGSTFQHKMANLHPEERITPVMLNEITLPEVMSDASYRRSRGRREFASRVPVYKTSPETQYESSDHLAHKEFHERPMYYPPYGYRDVESRVTRERIHRSVVDGRMTSEAVWTGEEFHHMYPPYHESSGELYSYPRHQMHYHGRRRTEYRPVIHRPYSGETARSGYRVVDSYSHLYPSEVRRGHYGPTEPYESYYTDSDYYARSRETFSGDQRHRDERMSRLKSRRNEQQPVQHFQPIGGAAPFITCYQCSELLQLPSDFLVMKGIRVHRLKCSACSSILKFSLERSCHLVPYVPKALNKSSSADHDYEALHRSASASISSARSEQKASFRSSSQAPERPNSEQSHDKGKSVMHNRNNTAGSSSSPDMVPRNAKVTWRLPDRNNSPLHRLMGYSSPSAVLYGYGSDDSETRSHSRKGATNFTPQSDNI